MVSENVKLDSAIKKHERLGNLKQVRLVINATDTVGEVNEVCALAMITQTPYTDVAETFEGEILEIQ